MQLFLVTIFMVGLRCSCTGLQITNILRWHSDLMMQDVFCKSESEVTGDKGILAFKVCSM